MVPPWLKCGVNWVLRPLPLSACQSSRGNEKEWALNKRQYTTYKML